MVPQASSNKLIFSQESKCCQLEGESLKPISSIIREASPGRRYPIEWVNSKLYQHTFFTLVNLLYLLYEHVYLQIQTNKIKWNKIMILYWPSFSAPKFFFLSLTRQNVATPEIDIKVTCHWHQSRGYCQPDEALLIKHESSDVVDQNAPLHWDLWISY